MRPNEPATMTVIVTDRQHNAAKKWGRAHGYHVHAAEFNGWVYDAKDMRVCHGWSELWLLIGGETIEAWMAEQKAAANAEKDDEMSDYKAREKMSPDERRAATVSSILNTSVDDAKSSLDFISDLEVLRHALEQAKEHGYKTLTKVIQARINKVVEKGWSDRHPGVSVQAARQMASSGADYVKICAHATPVELLRAALEYAETHDGTKTLIETLGREIRRKEREG